MLRTVKELKDAAFASVQVYRVPIPSSVGGDMPFVVAVNKGE